MAKKTCETTLGRVAYLESGPVDKPAILLVHGIPTSCYLWREVMRLFCNDFHCLAPDLFGLGDSVPANEDLPLHMENQAEMLAEFMENLGHKHYSVICHDQGGAAAQILATRFKPRIDCWVITDCVAYDNWPVPVIKRLQRFSAIPWLSEWVAGTGIFRLLETATPFGSFRRGVWRPERFTDEAIEEYLRPLHESAASRRRFLRFILAGHERDTLNVVDGLKEFDKPTKIVWAAEDRYISPSWGWKLYQDIPGAQEFELVPFCSHFWQEEQPAEFASRMGPFLARHARKPETKPRAKAKKPKKKKTANHAA